MGAVETLILFIAIWWVWVDTAWATNWLDPDRRPVRIMLFGMMAAGMAMAVALPRAFGTAGLVFAVAHVAMQVGRTAFTWQALEDAQERRNFLRILVWKLAAAPFWIAGGWLEGGWRPALWTLALGIESAGPALFFRLPFLGRSGPEDWRVEGSHMAERCALFLIIALGESILVTGATFADQEWNTPTILAFATAFTGTLLMWWVYFDSGAERGEHHIRNLDQPGLMARLGYTYLHALIIAGIVIAAAGDEILLTHPEDRSHAATVLLVLGGPAVFLAGCGWFKAIALGWFPLSHRVGLGLLAAMAALGWLLPALTLAIGAVLALAVVAIWERLSLRRPMLEKA
jgi:low temperature requirement protein LtrA